MWHDDTFSQRNKATKKNRWGEGVTQNLKKGEGVSNIVGLGTLCQLWNFAKFFKNLFLQNTFGRLLLNVGQRSYLENPQKTAEKTAEKAPMTSYKVLLFLT